MYTSFNYGYIDKTTITSEYFAGVSAFSTP